MSFDTSTVDGLIKQQTAQMWAGAHNDVSRIGRWWQGLTLFGLGGAEAEGGAAAAKTVLQTTAHVRLL